MSSGDEADSSTLLPRLKKRRTPRACDFCRRRKIRCNSAEMSDNRCSNCIEFGMDCTHEEVAKRRVPAKSYVEGLEQRLAKLEKLLHELSPESDFSQELGDFPPASGDSSPFGLGSSRIPQIFSMIDRTETQHGAEDELEVLTARVNQLPFHGIQNRFFGKASTFMFVQTALDHKKEFTGEDNVKKPLFSTRRAEYWGMRPWELLATGQEPRSYIFPDYDLIASLGDLYFTKENMYLPLLHRPTFEKSIMDGLHLKNRMFGATVLLVCALGARHSNDPRVFLDGANSLHSAGWKWFSQVQLLQNKSFLLAPSLYELQAYCLLLSWLQLSPSPQPIWPMVSMGIRLAQDVGAHRRKPYHAKWTVEDELMKRAFWILVCYDRNVSAFIGRPRATQDDDFDLDLPIECDDEYWETEDPEMAFKQPAGKPSTMAYFISFLKLGEVLGYVLRSIYSIGKSKIHLGIVGPKWEQQIVAELDSTLNKWIDSVPEHLRWDPHRENELFFNQSASLFIHYYHMQILVHRPFISSPSKPSKLAFPSLAICTNAARSCCHVADIQSRRGPSPLSHVQMAIFAASIVLLLNIWGGRQAGILTDAKKEMADVHKCMRILKSVEERFYPASRFWDILYELAYVKDLPLPQPSPETRNKRGRDDNDDDSLDSKSSILSPPSSSLPTDSQRSLKGNWRLSKDSPSPLSTLMPGGQTSEQTSPHMCTLPMYTDELGRLPLHGLFNFFSHNNPSSFEQFDYPIDSFPPLDNHLFGTNANSISSTFAMRDVSLFSDSSANTQTTSDALPRDANPLQDQVPAQPITGASDQLWRAWPLDPSFSTPTAVDSDTIAMWSNAPTTFGLSDWGSYVSNVSVNPTAAALFPDNFDDD